MFEPKRDEFAALIFAGLLANPRAEINKPDGLNGLMGIAIEQANNLTNALAQPPLWRQMNPPADRIVQPPVEDRP